MEDECIVRSLRSTSPRSTTAVDTALQYLA